MLRAFFMSHAFCVLSIVVAGAVPEQAQAQAADPSSRPQSSTPLDELDVVADAVRRMLDAQRKNARLTN